MNDAFARLGLARHPWIEADEVRAAFHRLAATNHPDRAGSTADFSELTRAYEILRDPASRLRHFLAIEQPDRAPDAGIPADLIEWFPRVAAQLQALKRGDAGDAETTLAELTASRETAHARIRELDANHFDELAHALARLGFLDKWIAQLSEGLLALKL
ncbi:MAG: DnaJ domain-containing protein [Chthoniobacteraceae bacterium]